MATKPREPIAGSFDEYRQLILHTLERLQLGITTIEVKVDQLRNEEMKAMAVDIAMLKVRASIFGAIAGSLGGAIVGVLVVKVFG
jgi:hypothetical protein